MDLIGGGAKNYTEMLKFLGDKKPFAGSPFQINFPTKYSDPELHPVDMKPKKCNDEDPDYRCVCVDCPEVCPTLPDVKDSKSCKVGLLPCLSLPGCPPPADRIRRAVVALLDGEPLTDRGHDIQFG